MLKEKLKRQELTIGSWIMMRDSIAVEVLADSGLDWLAIDMEHGPISIDIAADLIRVGRRCGIDMLVRVPDHNGTTIKRVLDAGANGIIVPDVRNVLQTETLLEYARYPSQRGDARTGGVRGAGLAKAQGYGRRFAEYYKNWNDDLVFIPQIEHIDAIPNACAIAALEGVDALFVGPYDLSASMGKAGELSDPEVMKNVSVITEAAKSAGKSAGFHSVSPNIQDALSFIDKGVTFLAYAADVFMLRGQIDSFISVIKEKKNIGGSKQATSFTQ